MAECFVDLRVKVNCELCEHLKPPCDCATVPEAVYLHVGDGPAQRIPLHPETDVSSITTKPGDVLIVSQRDGASSFSMTCACMELREKLKRAGITGVAVIGADELHRLDFLDPEEMRRAGWVRAEQGLVLSNAGRDYSERAKLDNRKPVKAEIEIPASSTTGSPVRIATQLNADAVQLSATGRLLMKCPDCEKEHEGGLSVQEEAARSYVKIFANELTDDQWRELLGPVNRLRGRQEYGVERTDPRRISPHASFSQNPPLAELCEQCGRVIGGAYRSCERDAAGHMHSFCGRDCRLAWSEAASRHALVAAVADQCAAHLPEEENSEASTEPAACAEPASESWMDRPRLL